VALRQRGAGLGQTDPCALHSRHHRIGDGEVIEAGFVGPVAEVVIRQAIGGIRGGPEAGGYGGESQMVQASSRAQPSGSAG